jgi:hypothetical protein
MTVRANTIKTTREDVKINYLEVCIVDESVQTKWMESAAYLVCT